MTTREPAFLSNAPRPSTPHYSASSIRNTFLSPSPSGYTLSSGINPRASSTHPSSSNLFISLAHSVTSYTYQPSPPLNQPNQPTSIFKIHSSTHSATTALPIPICTLRHGILANSKLRSGSHCTRTAPLSLATPVLSLMDERERRCSKRSRDIVSASMCVCLASLKE